MLVIFICLKVFHFNLLIFMNTFFHFKLIRIFLLFIMLNTELIVEGFV